MLFNSNKFDCWPISDEWNIVCIAQIPNDTFSGVSKNDIINNQIIVKCWPVNSEFFYNFGIGVRPKKLGAKLGPYKRPLSQLKYMHQLNIHQCKDWNKWHDRTVIFRVGHDVTSEIKKLLHISYQHQTILLKYFQIECKNHSFSRAYVCIYCVYLSIFLLSFHTIMCVHITIYIIIYNILH